MSERSLDALVDAAIHASMQDREHRILRLSPGEYRKLVRTYSGPLGSHYDAWDEAVLMKAVRLGLDLPLPSVAVVVTHLVTSPPTNMPPRLSRG